MVVGKWAAEPRQVHLSNADTCLPAVRRSRITQTTESVTTLCAAAMVIIDEKPLSTAWHAKQTTEQVTEQVAERPIQHPGTERPIVRCDTCVQVLHLSSAQAGPVTHR